MYRIPALGLYRGYLVSIGYALCDPIGGISMGSYRGGSLWVPLPKDTMKRSLLLQGTAYRALKVHRSPCRAPQGELPRPTAPHSPGQRYNFLACAMSPLLSRVRCPMEGRTPLMSYLGRMVSRKIPLWGNGGSVGRTAQRRPLSGVLWGRAGCCGALWGSHGAE